MSATPPQPAAEDPKASAGAVLRVTDPMHLFVRHIAGRDDRTIHKTTERLLKAGAAALGFDFAAFRAQLRRPGRAL